MASKKDYDKVVKKNGKLASFLSEKPLSAAQRKAAGTKMTDASAKMAGDRANLKAAAKKRKK